MREKYKAKLEENPGLPCISHSMAITYMEFTAKKSSLGKA
ncbi:hypothetical protein SpAn4DRAFT_2281 [Sporomusa ovata]|uniref:Uncharacterized protein n=1 Tax=Sporomusa ovata TaxID=2378 RepID=A0A0U1L142_9FIRM|nr:hypothetical protein SpAn4DRAFT_2281 [Sporomusa ovata]